MSDKNQPTMSRRQVLEQAAITAGVAAALQLVTRESLAANHVTLAADQTVLFQGDSITDAGRDRRAEGSPNHARGLGTGYPMRIGGDLLRDHAKLKLKVFNRGISGNKVPDLAKRWQKDCLDLNPNVLSILVGVNDIWHKLAGRFDGTVQSYEDDFAALLVQTRKALPKTIFVVCEPFVLRCGAINESWFPEFDHRRAAAKRVAEKAGAIWLPYQTMFDEAVAKGTDPSYWAGDGVHPTMAGHALMAQTWRTIVGI